MRFCLTDYTGAFERRTNLSNSSGFSKVGGERTAKVWKGSTGGTNVHYLRSYSDTGNTAKTREGKSS